MCLRADLPLSSITIVPLITLKTTLLSVISRKSGKKEPKTYRHKGLCNTGEHSRTQGMHQDLVLCDSQHQQSGCVLRPQIQEQRGEASTTTRQISQMVQDRSSKWSMPHNYGFY